MKAEPVAEPVKTTPAKTEPVKTTPAKTEPVKAEPVKAEPVKAEPVKAEPAKVAEPDKKIERARAREQGTEGLRRVAVCHPAFARFARRFNLWSASIHASRRG